MKHLAWALLVCVASTGYGEDLELRITTVSHQTDRYGYTITTPETSNANCNVYGNNVNCHSTTYGGGTQEKAVYRMTEVVTGNNMRYALQRTARWAWQNTDFLNDGETFDAKIKGRSMFITCRRGGNQGKKESIKYEVMDIRPVTPALPSVQSTQPVAIRVSVPSTPPQQPSPRPVVQVPPPAPSAQQPLFNKLPPAGSSMVIRKRCRTVSVASICPAGRMMAVHLRRLSLDPSALQIFPWSKPVLPWGNGGIKCNDSYEFGQCSRS